MSAQSLPGTTDFHVRFDLGEPNFATIADAVVLSKIAYAAQFCDPMIWGAFYQEGVLLRAAHELATDLDQAARGGAVRVARELESQSVGGVSLSRAQGIAREAADTLNRTIYGQKWVQLRNKYVSPGGLTMGGMDL